MKIEILIDNLSCSSNLYVMDESEFRNESEVFIDI